MDLLDGTAKRALRLGLGQARVVGHNIVGAEFILLGALMVRPDSGFAVIQAMREVTPRGVQERIELITAYSDTREPLVREASFRDVLTRAHHAHARFGSPYVSIPHLLLAIAEGEGELAYGILSKLGADPAAIQTEITGMLAHT